MSSPDARVGSRELTALAAVLFVAAGLRAWLSIRLMTHVDEPASMLAAARTAELGIPRFPSGILYTQGFVQSYLLAPMALLGPASLDDLPAWRIPSVLAGTAAIVPAWALARQAGGPLAAGITAASLAVCPAAMQWSAHVRPYGLSQLFTLGLALAFARALAGGSGGARSTVAMVLLFALGVFTHVGIGLVWPGLMLAALVLVGRDLLAARRDLLAGLLAMGLGPGLLFALNALAGTTSRGATDDVPGRVGFVGDHLLDLARLTDPTFVAWRSVYPWQVEGVLMGYVAVGGLLALAAPTRMGAEARAARLTALFGFFIPLAALVFAVESPEARYLVHVLGLSYVLPAVAMGELLGASDRRQRAFGGLALAVWTGCMAWSATWRLGDRDPGGASLAEATAWVGERARPDETILLSLTPVAVLAWGDRPNTWFIGGPETTARASRYTRPGPDGPIDYWAGWPSITRIDTLCRVLHDEPDAWWIIATARLYDPSGWRGRFERVFAGATEQVWTGIDGSSVHRTRPPSTWSALATRTCAPQAPALPPP